MRTVFPVRKGTRSTHLICRAKDAGVVRPSGEDEITYRLTARVSARSEAIIATLARRRQGRAPRVPGGRRPGARRRTARPEARPLVGDRRRGSFRPAEAVPDVTTAERGGGDHIRLRSSRTTIRSRERANEDGNSPQIQRSLGQRVTRSDRGTPRMRSIVGTQPAPGSQLVVIGVLCRRHRGAVPCRWPAFPRTSGSDRHRPASRSAPTEPPRARSCARHADDAHQGRRRRPRALEDGVDLRRAVEPPGRDRRGASCVCARPDRAVSRRRSTCCSRRRLPRSGPASSPSS